MGSEQYNSRTRIDSIWCRLDCSAVGRDRTTTVGFFDERIGNDEHVFYYQAQWPWFVVGWQMI